MNNSPYLVAVQRISGVTPREKCQTLIGIARQIIEKWEGALDSIEVIPTGELPKALVPWVKLEIGQILHLPRFITQGILSDDRRIFLRALKMKWFFKKVGTVNYPDYEYFKLYAFPLMSFRNRKKLIKTLAVNLSDPMIIESFYVTVTEMYGLDEARPFLKYCRGLFIWHYIYEFKVRLTLKELIYIYSRNPSFVLIYLNLLNEEEFQYEHLSKSNMQYDTDSRSILRAFLPRLLKHHSPEFSKLMKKFDNLRILLNCGKTALFLKKERQTFLSNPCRFGQMVSLRKATSILSEDQFKFMLKKLLPDQITLFDFTDTYTLVEFVPQQKKMPIILQVFKDKYGYDFMDDDQLVASAIRYLPPEVRHKEAVRLMDSESRGIISNRNKLERMWRCYLPLQVSLPMIMTDLYNCVRWQDKIFYFQQVIFSCAVNESFDNMLDMLFHLCEHYSYLDEWVKERIFHQITHHFDLTPYIAQHWQSLYRCISILNIRSGSHESVEMIWKIIVHGIRVDLKSKRKVDEKITILTEINELNYMRPVWNILTDVAFFERLCLELFMDMIFLIYAHHQQKNTDVWKYAIVSLASAIFQYNRRHNLMFEEFFGPLSVRDCVWLYKDICKLLTDYFDGIEDFDCTELITLLIKYEPTVVRSFIETEDFYNISDALITLNDDFTIISHKWMVYYKLCKKNVTKKSGRLFLYRIQWYRWLPRVFVEHCFKEISMSLDKQAMKMLAILIEGTVFTSIAEAITNDVEEASYQQSKIKEPLVNRTNELHVILLKVAETIKYMNVPFTLEFILLLCDFECPHLISECFTGLERQVPPFVIKCFLDFVQDKTGMSDKQAIRIFQKIASTDFLQPYLLELLANPVNDAKTRKCIIKNIYNTFITRPTDSTWRMMLTCLNELKKKDQNVLEIIACYRRVINRYIEEYINTILRVFIEIETDSKASYKGLPAWDYIPNVLASLSTDITQLFSEETHEKILEKWLTDVKINNHVIHSSMKYFIDCYIIPASENQIEGRLEFFARIFKTMLFNYLPILSSTKPNSSRLFVKIFFGEFIAQVILQMPAGKNKKLLIDIAMQCFLEILRPRYDMQFYCYLKLTDLFDKLYSPKEMAEKIGEMIVTLFELFGVPVLRVMPKYLFQLIKMDYKGEFLYETARYLRESGNDTNIFIASRLLLEVTRHDPESYGIQI